MLELIQKYKDGMSSTYSASYVRKTGHTLKAFSQYCREQGIEEFNTLEPLHLYSWAESLCPGETLESLSSTSTLELKYNAVRQFLKWLCVIGKLDQNPWPKELKIKVRKRGTRYVPRFEELDAAIFKVELNSWYPLRDRAILELVYGSGLRRCEVYPLNLEDLTGRTLRVVGKYSKEREVPITAVALSYIREYLQQERRAILEQAGVSLQEPALFVGRFGKRVGLEWYSYLFRKLRHGEKKNQRVTLHGLRHACATHMLQRGASTVVLQKMLGHESIRSTQIYTEVIVDDLKGMLSRCHPRG